MLECSFLPAAPMDDNQIPESELNPEADLEILGVSNPMDRVIQNLYIGGYVAANNVDLLKAENIRSIVSVMRGAPKPRAVSWTSQ